MANIYQQVVRMFGDGYKDLIEENGISGSLSVLCFYSCRSLGVFSDGGGISMTDGGGENR